MSKKEPKYVIIIKARGQHKYQDYLSFFETLSFDNKRKKKRKKEELE